MQPLPLGTFPVSSKPTILFMERDVLSLLLIPIYLFIFLAIRGAGFADETHFIFIFTVSVLTARSAFIRLRIALSCMRANK